MDSLIGTTTASLSPPRGRRVSAACGAKDTRSLIAAQFPDATTSRIWPNDVQAGDA
jgi:hypothetical protein